MLDISPEILTLLMFVGLFLGLFLGHPLYSVLGGLAVFFGIVGWGPACFPVFINRIFGIMDNFILAAIPLFILMANFLEKSGVADGLFESLRYLLGPLRGGVGTGGDPRLYDLCSLHRSRGGFGDHHGTRGHADDVEIRL